MKPVLGLAASGVLALVLWKVMVLFLLPLVGVAIGFVLVALKIGFIIGAILLAMWLFRRMSRSTVTG